MGHRSNQPTTGRNFVFSESGNNELSGTSDENPLADPYAARDRVDALSPPVSSTDRATISGQGTFGDYLSLPRFTAIQMAPSSILSFVDLVNLEAGGDQSIEIGSLLNFVASGICFKSDGKTRVSADVTAMVVNGEDGIGFNVSGVSDDSFFGLTQGELRGEGATMIAHAATSPSPIHYRFNLVEMFDIDQALIDYDPIAGSSQTVIEITTVAEGEGATTTGCILFKVRSGILVVESQVLSCDSIADVFNGAILTLSSQVINGNTLVQTGGVCIYKSSSLLQGDMETQGTGTLQIDANNITGNAINTGSMSIRCDSFTGEITNTGNMFVIIGAYSGTMPDNDGSINGRINGILYGDWREKLLLRGAEFTNQIPSGLDTPLQIIFGSAQGSGSDPVMLSAAGALTANVPNEYHLHIFLQYGRTGAGMFSKLFFRVLLNGSQVGDSVEAKLDNANDDVPVQFSSIIPMVAGDVLTTELVRDSGGGNSGELVSETPVLGWNSAPSAVIRVSI